MRRSKEDSEQTRTAILDAAERMFCEKGYAAATVESISRAAGLTRGAFYWRFRDKAEEIRRWVQGLSQTELQGVLDGIRRGGLGSFEPEPERHTPQMPALPDPPDETLALTVRVDVDELKPPVWRAT